MIAATFIKRLWQLCLIVLLVTAATFVLSRLIPGDFFTLNELEYARSGDTLAALRHRYSLDQPIAVQYYRWLKNLCRLDLGYSLFYRAPVRSVVVDAMARTCWIGFPALILGYLGGVILGSLHALVRDRILGRLLDFLTGIALSLPSLILGLGALLFASRTGWFPLGGMTSADLVAATPWQSLLDRLHHLTLPVTCLTIPILISFERIQYSSTVDTLKELHVRAAKARGLSRNRIFYQYLVRPSLNPTLSTLGPMFGAVLSGSLVLEVIFSWPGLGKITFDALFSRDLFLLLGCVICSSILLVLGNFAADVLLSTLDPRVRAAEEGET
jgi:peptide/nickel transport system permease protein